MSEECDDIKCPKCGSKNYRYTWTETTDMNKFVDCGYYCNDCKHSFKRSEFPNWKNKD